MLLNKEIECILRAILYPKSQICLVYKDGHEAKKCMDDFEKIIKGHKILKAEIDKDIYDKQIVFKNGSYINVLKKREVDNSQTVRGRRADNWEWFIQDGNIIPQNVFDEVIKPFMKRKGSD